MSKEINILARADASDGIGVGHFIRLKSIISEAPANYKFLLVCAFECTRFAEKIFSGLHNVEVHPISSNLAVDHLPSSSDEICKDAHLVKTIMQRKNFDAILIDHYKIDQDWLFALEPEQPTVKINDVFDNACMANVQLCPIMNISGNNTEEQRRASRLDLIGPKYIPVSIPWRRLRRRRTLDVCDLKINISLAL